LVSSPVMRWEVWLSFSHPNRSDGGTWNTIAGQPTDDFEMALRLGYRPIKDVENELPLLAKNQDRTWSNSEPEQVGRIALIAWPAGRDPELLNIAEGYDEF